MQIMSAEVIEILDSRNPPGRITTAIHNSVPLRSRAEPTEGEFAAYLAGEYAMLVRLIDNGALPLDYAANLIGMSVPQTLNHIRIWRKNDIAEQRDTAARMIMRRKENT